MSRQDGTAVLLIHGILGTPNHFKPLLPLIPDSWSVCNLLLKGHGGSVKDFSHASMTQWKQQVSDSLDGLLAENNRVIIVAHSMGTLFAIQEAIETPAAGLFLLNVPLKVRITARFFKNVGCILRESADPEDPWSAAALCACSIQRDPRLYRYLGWIPRYLELFAQMRKTRRLVGQLKTPSRIFVSALDEMASPRSGDFFRGNPWVTLKTLPHSGHFYYSPEDLSVLTEAFQSMLQKVSL